MDFGIARTTTSGTITGAAMVMGTAPYLSPEQARGERVDARSDLYSLGCVLYEMLSGSPPFTAENPVAVAAGHVHGVPVPLRDRNPEVPAELEAVVMRCLEKDPDRRYGDALALRDALAAGEVAATVSVSRPAGDTDVLPAHQAPDRPRHGRFLALLGALAVLGFLVAWAIRSVGTPAPEPAPERGPEVAAEEPTAAEEPADLRPEDAYLALAGVVEEGVDAEGDVDDALDEVRTLREEVLDRTPEEITAERAAAILDAATALETSIRGHPAPADDDDGLDGEDGDDDDDDDDGTGLGRGRGRSGGPPGGAPPGRS